MEDYTVMKKLAQGGQGATMLVKHNDGSATMVLKQCKCENLKEANAALKEAKVLQRLNNPSIVRYHDVFLGEEGQYLIICTLMEYCSGGDLAVYMNKLRHDGHRIPERTVLAWTVDMMTGLNYLHSSQIVHRDMKPLNCFITSGGSIKIGDFGLASSLKRDKQTSKVGTPCYLSPEILQNDSYGPAVDMWGAGCIVLEMMTFNFLWERRGMLSVQVLSRPLTHDDFPCDHSHALKNVAISMLDKEPENRPLPSEVAFKCRQILDGNADGGGRGGERSPAANGGVEMGGIGQLAQGIEAIWKGSGSGGAAQSGAGVAGAEDDGGGPRGAAGGHGKYQGKVAEFRRKTPAQAARRPTAAPDAGGRGGRGDGDPSPKHAGVGGGAGQGKSRSAATERATPLNVKRALRKRNLERYIRLVEEQELYGDVLESITDQELRRDCGVQDAADRAALIDTFQNLLRHGLAYFDTEAQEAQREIPAAAAAAGPKAVRRPSAADGGADRRRERGVGDARERGHAEGRNRRGGSDVAAWLESAGLSKYQTAFDANGVCDLQTLAGLEAAQLKALGVKGRRENPYGPEETTSDLDVMMEALRGLRVVMGQGAAGAGGGAAMPGRRQGAASQYGMAGAGREYQDEEDALVKQAIEESLAEYHSSTSASGSAPGSRNSRCQPLRARVAFQPPPTSSNATPSLPPSLAPSPPRPLATSLPRSQSQLC
jgi:NIMA (never in mitosis gene a)-related kinase